MRPPKDNPGLVLPTWTDFAFWTPEDGAKLRELLAAHRHGRLGTPGIKARIYTAAGRRVLCRRLPDVSLLRRYAP